MPDANFAAGLLNGYFGTVAKERDRRDKNALDAANFLMSTGRVKDMNDLTPLLGPLFDSHVGPKTGKGKGGKGGKGQQDPQSILAQFINPALQQQGKGGSAAPAEGQPPSSGKPLFSEDEMQARGEAAQGRTRAANLEDDLTRERQRTEGQIAVQKAKPQTGVSPGSVGADVMAAVDVAVEKKGGVPLTSEEYEQVVSDVRKRRAGETRAPEKLGTPSAFFTQKEKELGHKLTAADMLTAREEYFKAGGGQTAEEKQKFARAMADYRNQQNLPTTESVAGESQAIKLGGQDVPYLNLDSFTGEKSKNKARADAIKNGVIPVSKQQADQLAAANTAIGSLTAFLADVKDKLPADAQGRPFAQVTTPLKQIFQTDEDLAAAVAWDITVLPQLRAMNVSGRVPVFEFQKALAAQPRLTDTVGTAAKKMAIVQGVLERGARSILNRGGNVAGGGGGAKPDAKVTSDVTTRLKDAPPAKYMDKTSGTYWVKGKDGSITAITKAEYDK